MVCLNNIEAKFSEIHDYVLRCMLFHQHKEYIMFPYNQGGNHTYHPPSNLMQESCNSYVRQGGKHKTGRDSLGLIEKFKCPQQPETGNTCAFYVFHHMNMLTLTLQVVNSDLEERSWNMEGI
uniref:Uncharacterized protein n=1 Tax=Oryza rufipogon TaxID=4529 RepID=A0A0E0QY42_ORYRU